MNINALSLEEAHKVKVGDTLVALNGNWEGKKVVVVKTIDSDLDIKVKPIKSSVDNDYYHYSQLGKFPNKESIFKGLEDIIGSFTITPVSNGYILEVEVEGEDFDFVSEDFNDLGKGFDEILKTYLDNCPAVDEDTEQEIAATEEEEETPFAPHLR